MDFWYGLWNEKHHCWMTDGRTIMWGPEPVMQAQFKRLPPDEAEHIAIRRFNGFGQPETDE